MADKPTEGHSINVTVRVREFAIPPVSDGLVLGKSSPIGATAMKKALALLQSSAFDHIKIKDDVIGDVFVRSNILRRISRKQISSLAIDRIKPIMNDNEIMHLTIDVELILEEQL